MERVAAARSIFVVLVRVVVSSLLVLYLARRIIYQLHGIAEGSASSVQTLASPKLLLLRPLGQFDQDPHKLTNLEAAAEEEDDPAALAVPDRLPPDADLEALRSGSGGGGTDGDAASLPAAAAEEEEEENAVAGAEADRSSAKVMGWIPKEKEGERAKKRGKKPCDSDSDDEEEDDEGEAKKKKKKKMKKKKEKEGKGGFLRWFWRLVNRF